MEKNSAQRIYKVIMLVLIVAIVTSLITAFATYKYLELSAQIGLSKTDTTSIDGLEYTISRFRSMLQEKYLGEIDDEKMVEGAIKGYIAALDDPYTVYYTKEEMKEIMDETNGSYVGIGIYMTLDKTDNLITVVRPIENSPAEKAGILPGDIIKKVDGEIYEGEKMDEVTSKIKGEEGTTVKLEILRGTETKTFELKRTKVTINHITAEILDNNIGYIAISEFEGGCAEQFEEKYKELKKKGITKLIIDIRDNGGGIVDEAIDIADLMTEKGSSLLITQDKKGEEEITTAKKNESINMPTVILMNEYSASASEILAGALKDNGKAILVGTTTYGKGIIQELRQLSDGSGLKITTNEYFTPKHHSIHNIGIKPDIEVTLSEDAKSDVNLSKEKDTQLQKAIETLNTMREF